MFPKNSFLAVVGADDDFWLCRVVRKVDKSPGLAKVGEGGGFDVNWLERVSEEENENIYNASTTANAVELKSVVTRVYLKRRRDGGFELSDAQRRRVQRCLSKMADGESPTFHGGVNGFDIEDVEDGEEEEMGDEEKTQAASKKAKAKAPLHPFKRKEPRRKPLSTTKKSATVKTMTSVKAKKITAPKGPKTPKSPKSPKGPKAPKPPNWRLKENGKVDVLHQDPYFEMKRADQNCPFVSSVAHSKLLFNAIYNSDAAQLRRICEDVKQVHTLEPPRSMADELTPLECAVKTNKLSCAKELLKQLQNKTTRQQRAVRAPTCMMKSVGTGKYNYRSLGIKKIRRLNMSRGGREGNNALLKDARMMDLAEWDLSEKGPSIHDDRKHFPFF